MEEAQDAEEVQEVQVVEEARVALGLWWPVLGLCGWLHKWWPHGQE